MAIPSTLDEKINALCRCYRSDSIMSLTFDEYGRPFIIIREQGKKMRLKGRDAQKVDSVNT